MSNGGRWSLVVGRWPKHSRQLLVVGHGLKHLISVGAMVGIVVEFVAILSGGRGVTRA